jgi:hypothetical protein
MLSYTVIRIKKVIAKRASKDGKEAKANQIIHQQQRIKKRLLSEKSKYDVGFS